MKLEVFYDYACPYCYKGHVILKEILDNAPELEVEWLPCEAHPRPETYGLHSDLCARAYYLAKEQHADMEQFHNIMYQAAVFDKVNIEDPQVIAGLVSELLDHDAFLAGLKSDRYQSELDENNRQCWMVENFPAVPSLRMNGKPLPSVPEVGLTKARIESFLGL